MHLCMKSSPQASMSVFSPRPSNSRPLVHAFAILEAYTARSDLLANQFGTQTHRGEHRIRIDLDSPIVTGPVPSVRIDFQARMNT